MDDIKDIEKNYERMPDSKLIRIATTDAHGLRPEVFDIIEKELKKRNLDPALLQGARAQNKTYTLEEVEGYSNMLRELPCPICSSTSNKLNGTVAHTVKSFLVLTTSATEVTIACPGCLDKKNDDAILSTALLGWWGIPWGLIRTPIYIHRNMKAKKQNRFQRSNETMLSFTLGHIGELETYRNDKEKLKEVIQPKAY